MDLSQLEHAIESHYLNTRGRGPKKAIVNIKHKARMLSGISKSDGSEIKRLVTQMCTVDIEFRSMQEDYKIE